MTRLHRTPREEFRLTGPCPTCGAAAGFWCRRRSTRGPYCTALHQTRGNDEGQPT